MGTGKPGEGVIVWNKKVVLFNARIEKDNILYEKYSTNFHEKAQRKERDSARSTSPVRKENVTKSEEEPERWEERVPLQVAYKPEPEMPQNWQEEKPDVLQQGWGEQEWETVLQLAAFAPIRLGDVTALLRSPRGSTEAVGCHASSRCSGRERGLVSDCEVGEINEIE